MRPTASKKLGIPRMRAPGRMSVEPMETSMAKMTMSLEGRRVVVIGGATGIGFAVAELALARGAEVVVASSRRANVDAAVARLGTATGGTIDLRDE